MAAHGRIARPRGVGRAIASVAGRRLGARGLMLPVLARLSAQDSAEHLAEAGLVIGMKLAELPDDQAGFDGSEQGLDDRRLE